jgi:hypothetical protein
LCLASEHRLLRWTPYASRIPQGWSGAADLQLVVMLLQQQVQYQQQQETKQEGALTEMCYIRASALSLLDYRRLLQMVLLLLLPLLSQASPLHQSHH